MYERGFAYSSSLLRSFSGILSSKAQRHGKILTKKYICGIFNSFTTLFRKFIVIVPRVQSLASLHHELGQLHSLFMERSPVLSNN